MVADPAARRIVDFEVHDVSTDAGWDQAHQVCEVWGRENIVVAAISLDHVVIFLYIADARDSEVAA